MRIWIGKEKEGAQQGRETIFIEETHLQQKQVQKIRQAAKGCDRLYFGAGKKDIEFVENNFFNNFQDKQVIIETSVANLCKIIRHLKNIEIIIRLELPAESANIKFYPKIEYSNKSVTIFKEGIKNDISEINKGMYKDDIILWEE